MSLKSVLIGIAALAASSLRPEFCVAAPVTYFHGATALAESGYAPNNYDSHRDFGRSAAVVSADAATGYQSIQGTVDRAESAGSYDPNAGAFRAYAHASRQHSATFYEYGTASLGSASSMVFDTMTLPGGGEITFNFGLEGFSQSLDDLSASPFYFLSGRVWFDVFILKPGGVDLYWRYFNGEEIVDEQLLPLYARSIEPCYNPTPESFSCGTRSFDESLSLTFTVPEEFGVYVHFFVQTAVVETGISTTWPKSLGMTMNFMNTATMQVSSSTDNVIYSSSGLLPGTRAAPTDNQVSEPATYALALGAVGAAVLARRRRAGRAPVPLQTVGA